MKPVLNDWGRRVADGLMEAQGLLTQVWSYDYGVVWHGMALLYAKYGDKKYFDYIQKGVDSFLNADGSAIRDYTLETYNIDHLNNGKAILYLYEQTGQEKYRHAAALLRSQLDGHPRIPSGGFWHKQIYPNQMWLDGLYMGAAFYARYAALFESREEAYQDIALQFETVYRFTLDEKTGLCRHAYDDARVQTWADPVTGRSAHAWGRANGWFMAALADTLTYFPKEHPGYLRIANILRAHAKAVWDARERQSSLWYQVMDQPNRPGNYLESSCACLFAYGMLSGASQGVLDGVYATYAKEAYKGIVNQFVETVNGHPIITKCCQVAGLGGMPYREGSYAYYLSEPIIARDLKATGAFIQAAAMAEG